MDGGMKLKDDPKVGEMVHGGFRQNRNLQPLEDLADERGMGRELLRETGDIYPNELLTQGNSDIMKAVTPEGKNGQVVSKWSKGT